MYRNIINKIHKICFDSKSEKEIFYNIKKMLIKYKPCLFGEIINNEINKTFDEKKLQIIKNNDNSYYKYNIYNSEMFDVFDIKWEKNSISKIHNHPEKGCIVYLYNHGNLSELNFHNSCNKLEYFSTKNLEYGNIGYKIGDEYIHQICSNIYTETVHIYIPGNFKNMCYTLKKN